jgi:hypothetical protein
VKVNLGRCLPRKLGNLTNEVEVGRRTIGGGVHVNESHVMPQRDQFRPALIGGLDAILGGVFVAVRVELEVGGGAVGLLLPKGLAKRHLRLYPEYHFRSYHLRGSYSKWLWMWSRFLWVWAWPAWGKEVVVDSWRKNRRRTRTCARISYKSTDESPWKLGSCLAGSKDTYLRHCWDNST